MKSYRLELEKFILYFKSRDRKIEKAMFCLNQGYTRLWIPLIASGVFFLIQFFIFKYYIEFDDDIAEKILIPTDYLRKVLLANFNIPLRFDSLSVFFSSIWIGIKTISIPKIISIFIEVCLAYSFISWLIALKKVLGFKIET